MIENKVPSLRFVLEEKECGNKWISGKSWQELNDEIKALQETRKGIWNKIDKIDNAVFRLQEVCLSQLVGLCKKAMLEYLEQNLKAKAFHSWDVRKALDASGFDWDVSKKAFELLEKEGMIIRKGSWYRLREVENP